MRLIATVAAMRETSRGARREGKTMAFVPTMGYLHRGHLALLKEAKKRADLVVASIFVNPTQFNESEDFSSYPREPERDRKLLEENGVDILFLPTTEQVYPEGFQTTIDVTGLSEGLCGSSRPGHFSAVATVVAKLFNILRPDVALFGEKDYQQLALIRRMNADLNFGISIVGVPTVREHDGLAMSSRNAGLSPEERKAAPSLYRALSRGRKLFERGERKAEAIIGEAKGVIENPIELDYLEIRDSETLAKIEEISGEALFAIAARAGKTRLIDNIILKEE